MLGRIGDQLDKGVFPRVANGGLVLLNESAVPATQSMEKQHGREARGSQAGARQGFSRWQAPSRGSWSRGDAAQVIGADPEAHYHAQLSGLAEQYPGAQFCYQAGGIWLLTQSTLLPALRQYAIFLTGISFPGRMVRTWAFWGDPIMYPDWVGPRHTNFPDGSICAFEPLDQTWVFGESLVKLLDINTVWAIRHLHLQAFGRWPGQQSIHFVGERMLELRPDEPCGCMDGTKLYRDCCMPADLTANRIEECLRFFWATGGIRRPPVSVVAYVRHGAALPNLAELVTRYSPLALFNFR